MSNPAIPLLIEVRSYGLVANGEERELVLFPRQRPLI